MQEISAARASVVDSVLKLEPPQLDIVFLGAWTVKDLLSHLIVWDSANMQAINELRESQLPEFYSHIDADWRSYNALLVERYYSDDINALLSRAELSHTELLRKVDSLPPAELDRDWGVRYKGYRVTIARLLQVEAGDEQEHARQIREYFGLPARAM